ncbi:diacylglycerol kinase family protein [Tunicatimonas pelagia]|uniref:diacylglycerol kinase family protein n=1 Tax=Tunicatimonas pelagia TaxID=931531 RepID=UPI002666E1A4|nr:diacylglycerol kinase family protein [Tunicatimonas pelagia]WKN45026.1 diacylglycerol kinase family protein [Tunicatimonas pelagia]
MSAKKFSIIDRIKSFHHAFSGLQALFREEHNARVHLAITLLVIILGAFFSVSATEWIVIVLTVGFVFVTEILNTAVEHIADFISPQRDDRIKRIKDLGAAAVLLSAITAVVIGVIIFLPKLGELFF